MKISYVLLLTCILNLCLWAEEDRSKNPLYRPLSLTAEPLEKLLNIEPYCTGFIAVPFRDSLEANWLPTESNFFEDPGIKIAEERFNCFCQDFDKSSLNSSSIPRVIHLIWLGSQAPESVKIAMDSWQKNHPSWEIKLWTDSELKEFTWSNKRSEEIFQKGINWAEKSDILRFEILYQFGGIYSDTDVICLKSFEDLISSNLTFFAGLESNKIKRFGRPLVGSAIIGACKNSTVIKKCIEYTQSIEEAPMIHQYIRSGPGPITKACYESLEEGVKEILLLPCSYLYPLPWEKRLVSPLELLDNIREESFAVHLWEGSWFDSYHPPKAQNL